MKIIASLSLIALLASRLWSQDAGIIRGFIFDIETRLPVESAEIIVSGTSKGTISDHEGYFYLAGVPAGEVTLVIKHISYNVYQKKLIAGIKGDKPIRIFLTPVFQNLSEIVVEAEAEQESIISRLPYIEAKISKKQIDENAVRDIGDLLRSAANVSGIRKGGSAIDPVVRGFKFSQLNVQIDQGVKVEGGCPNRMDPATAHIDPGELTSVEIIKGPYALKYGPSFGGVINLVTKTPKREDSAYIHFNALKGYESNWNGHKEQAEIYGGKKWFSFGISGGRMDYGNYKDGNGNKVNSEFDKFYYKAQVGFNPGDRQYFRFSFQRSEGKDVRFPALMMDERLDETQIISADYEALFKSKALKSFKLKLYQSDVRHEMDNKHRPNSDTVVAVSIITAKNRGARAETKFRLGGGILIAGSDFEQTYKDGERIKNMIMQPELPVKRERLWNNGEIINSGFFAEYNKSINSIQLLGSIRADYNTAVSDGISVIHPQAGEIYTWAADSTRSQYLNLSFSVGLTKFLSQNFSVSFSAGRGVRSPDMTERFIILLPTGYDNYDYLGNPALNPEANNQADLTFKYTGRKTGYCQFNLFYSIVNDFIAGKLVPPDEQTPLTAGVLGVKKYSNSGNAQFRGAELSYSLPQDLKFGLQIMASYTYATLDASERYLFDEMGNATGTEALSNDPVSEIPPLEFTCKTNYKFFGGRLIPGITARIVANKEKVSLSQYEQPTPGFFTSDVSVYYMFSKYLDVSIGAKNLFDRAYYEHLNRNIIGSNYSLYEPGRIIYFNLIMKL